MSWITNKVYYRVIYVIICIVSALIAVSPGIIASFLPDNLVWIAVIMIGPCVGQIFLVTVPITNALEEYRNACSKRGLIHEQDIYKLFEKNGTAKLHVGDIDQLPRYNVEIPETKVQVVVEQIPVVVEDGETEKLVSRGYAICLNCNKTLDIDIVDDEDFKHCPCCGNRITRYRVPKEWIESRKE